MMLGSGQRAVVVLGSGQWAVSGSAGIAFASKTPASRGAGSLVDGSHGRASMTQVDKWAGR